jgi:hypothetical protein
MPNSGRRACQCKLKVGDKRVCEGLDLHPGGRSITFLKFPKQHILDILGRLGYRAEHKDEADLIADRLASGAGAATYRFSVLHFTIEQLFFTQASATRDGSVQFKAVRRHGAEIKPEDIYPSVPAAEVLRRTTVLLDKAKAEPVKTADVQLILSTSAPPPPPAPPEHRTTRGKKRSLEGLVGGSPESGDLCRPARATSVHTAARTLLDLCRRGHQTVCDYDHRDAVPPEPHHPRHSGSAQGRAHAGELGLVVSEHPPPGRHGVD